MAKKCGKTTKKTAKNNPIDTHNKEVSKALNGDVVSICGELPSANPIQPHIDILENKGSESGDVVVSCSPSPPLTQGFRHCPKLDLDVVRKHLDNLTRSPFRDILTDVIAASPTIDNIMEYGAKYPDRWGQLLAILARLSGYTPELKIDGSIEVTAKDMSDSRLNEELVRIEIELAKLSNTH